MRDVAVAEHGDIDHVRQRRIQISAPMRLRSILSSSQRRTSRSEAELSVAAVPVSQSVGLEALTRLGTESLQTCMGLFLSRGCGQLILWLLFAVCCQFFVRRLKGPFLIPSPTIRFPERAQWGQGTEMLAKLGASPP